MSNVTSEERQPSVLMTVHDLGQTLKVSIRSIWRFRRSGLLPEPIRIGGAIRWRSEDVARWIEQGCPAVNQQVLESEGQA
ncbi:helix-turn-helix domain-containing protein [bacterium]|nr:helix-turn-helix domain-containing protein [bacterium]